MAIFEQRHGDVAGRIGELHLPRHSDPLTTPALLPVINPNIETITAVDIVDEFEPAGLITNAYVIYQHEELRTTAEQEGVHELLGVSCPVMTDSGSFQLAEYGEIDVGNAEIVTFQSAIGADICTPVDLPTPPDGTEEEARADLEITLKRIHEASSYLEDDQLLAGPVQGGSHPELRREAGRLARETEADIFPVGAVVPLMTDYRFRELVDIVIAAKRGLEPAAPVHLFGAGHPMMFALAAALGCDLFDSAAYALYARDGRYLTVDGTRHLDELASFPCACPVCTAWTPDEMEAIEESDRERLLSRHNLYVSFAELRRVRQAIRSGTLLELLERRARAHPAMLDAYRHLLEYDSFLEAHDPAIKGTFLYLSDESANRPEVHRHHERLRDWELTGKILLGSGVEPAPYDQQLDLRPPFGPIPAGLEHSYPLTAELPEGLDVSAYEAAARGVTALVSAASEASFTLVADGWPASAIERLPDTVILETSEGSPLASDTE